MQAQKTTTEFERDIENPEEGFAFGYAASQAHLFDDGPEDKLVFYRPECAKRELDN